jgi:hypothetical protein
MRHPMHCIAMQYKTDKALHSTPHHSPHLSVHQDLDVFKPARKTGQKRRSITHTATCSNSLPAGSTLRHMWQHCADNIAQSNGVSYTHAVSTTCLQVAGSCTLLLTCIVVDSVHCDVHFACILKLYGLQCLGLLDV